MSSYAAEFLRQFVDGKPWVHIDIAGTAWGLNRNYVGKGASGFGTAPADRAGPPQRGLTPSVKLGSAPRFTLCDIHHTLV